MKTRIFSALLFVLTLALVSGCSEGTQDPYSKYYSNESGSTTAEADRNRALGEYQESVQTALEGATGNVAATAPLGGFAGGGQADVARTGVTEVEKGNVGMPTAEENTPGPAGDEAEADVTTETETIAMERKLIYETSMTVVVDDLDQGRQDVEEIVKANHKEGTTPVFITQQQVDREVGRVGRIHYTIRCHADVRERVVAALREVGEVWAEDSTVEDVTRRYYDLEKQQDLLEADYAIAKAAFAEAEARGARAAELEMLKAEMERISEALGETKGQLKGFDDLITLPTIYLTLEEKDPTTSYSGWRVVEEGFTVAYKAIVNILKFVIIIVGVGLVVALLFLPTFLLVRWIVRSVQRTRVKE
ncbi:MAG: DUF4349 domain-containing protein [bacterium]|nr:DUF4349 domain-containing protein [bacterium]